jgi:hypothetical protein
LHVARAEVQLGFRLPELLSALYLQLANGGFGPEVIGLEGGETHEGMSLAELYALMRESHPDDPNWKWPTKLVPIVDWGCAMKSCVDCSEPPFQVIRFDPNGHTQGAAWDDSFFVESVSLVSWFEEWMDRMSGLRRRDPPRVLALWLPR